MIAVDSSALLAIVLREPLGPTCMDALAADPQLIISAVTLAESLIVLSRRNAPDRMARLLAGLGLEVVPVTAATATRIAAIYDRWGKGVHPAGLNLGDCFAFDAARQNACALLFIGNDFSRTDIPRVL